MKKMKWIVALSVFLTVSASQAFAADWKWKDASGDEIRKAFCDGKPHKKEKMEDGFKFFPAIEIGQGTGASTASLGLSVGYKYGYFFMGTSLRGQVVNIDQVNYQFMPATLNLMGLSYSVIPETPNDQNEKKLKGQSIGFGFYGKLTFTQLIETDPVTDLEKDYLVVSIGLGF